MSITMIVRARVNISVNKFVTKVFLPEECVVHSPRNHKKNRPAKYNSPVIMWPLRSFCTPYGALNTFGSRITNFRDGAYGFLEKNDYKHFCPKVTAGRFFFVVPGTMVNTFL